jgi:hypothetical protein
VETSSLFFPMKIICPLPWTPRFGQFTWSVCTPACRKYYTGHAGYASVVSTITGTFWGLESFRGEGLSAWMMHCDEFGDVEANGSLNKIHRRIGDRRRVCNWDIGRADVLLKTASWKEVPVGSRETGLASAINQGIKPP